jgi:RNA polymerases M/15 Kd subunit
MMCRPGSLLFCPDCGTLLDLPRADEKEVKCVQCGHLEPISCESGNPLVNSYYLRLNECEQHTMVSKSLLGRERTRFPPNYGKSGKIRHALEKQWKHGQLSVSRVYFVKLILLNSTPSSRKRLSVIDVATIKGTQWRNRCARRSA